MCVNLQKQVKDLKEKVKDLILMISKIIKKEYRIR